MVPLLSVQTRLPEHSPVPSTDYLSSLRVSEVPVTHGMSDQPRKAPLCSFKKHTPFYIRSLWHSSHALTLTLPPAACKLHRTSPTANRKGKKLLQTHMAETDADPWASSPPGST